MPDKPVSKDYGALVEALRATSGSKTNRHSRTLQVPPKEPAGGHREFQDYLDQAIRDRLVCGLSSEAIQKRLLSENNLMLAATQGIALRMEAAAKEASELHVSAVQGKDTCQRIVILKLKNVEIVVNKVTPTRYAGHFQKAQASPWEGIPTKKTNPKVRIMLGSQKTSLLGCL